MGICQLRFICAMKKHIYQISLAFQKDQALQVSFLVREGSTQINEIIVTPFTMSIALYQRCFLL